MENRDITHVAGDTEAHLGALLARLRQLAPDLRDRAVRREYSSTVTQAYSTVDRLREKLDESKIEEYDIDVFRYEVMLERRTIAALRNRSYKRITITS